MAEQFSTFKEDLENIGIHITDEQYSDLCEINLFMKGMPDIPVYNILLILKTLSSKKGVRHEQSVITGVERTHIPSGTN